MMHSCFCGSGLDIKECCYIKFPSIKPLNDLNFATNDFELWSVERRAVCISLFKLLEEFPNLENKNIIIYGAGKCTDLPMDFICGKFSEIVLVDIDVIALEEAKMNIPEIYLGKVTFVNFDVTGMTEILKVELYKSKIKTIEGILKFFNRMTKNIPLLILHKEILNKGPFAVSISDLILTQLYSTFYINHIFPYIIDNIEPEYRINDIFKYNEPKDFANGLTFQHLKLLYDTTEKETGKIMILADTFVFGKDNGRESDFNKEIISNIQYLTENESVTIDLISKWAEKYALAGSDILLPMETHKFRKLKNEVIRWWWWLNRKDRYYFVMNYILTPFLEDVDVNDSL